MRFIFDGHKLVEAAAPFWDVKGNMQDYFQDMIIEFLKAAGSVLSDLIYSATLIGGGLLVIIWAVTGEKKAGRWFGILFVVNAFIQLLGG